MASATMTGGFLRGRSAVEVLAGLVVIAVAVLFLVYAFRTANPSAGVGAGSIELKAQFDNIDGLNVGSDVRMAGVKVGQVVAQTIDPKTYLANVTISVGDGLEIPKDSSAEITSDGLLGGKFITLQPGGSDTMLKSGQLIANTQGSISLESLLGKFIFSASQMASQKSDDGSGQDAGQGAPAQGNGQPAGHSAP